MRGVLGCLQWLQMTRPDACVQTSILQSKVNQATVADLVELNKVVRDVMKHNDLEIVLWPIPLEYFEVVTYSDASWGVRADGSSQGGWYTCVIHVSTYQLSNITG